MSRKIISVAITAGISMTPLAAIAQDVVSTTYLAEEPGHLFVPIIAGLVLAFGFQLFMTLLSLAGGLSLTPNVMKAAAKSKAEQMAKSDKFHADMGDDDTDIEAHEKHHAAALGIVNTMGVWSVVTASIALFVACFLSIRLTEGYAMEYRYIVAAIIWAGFIILAAYLEGKGARSLVGSVVKLAVSGMQTGSEAVMALVEKSPEKRLEQAARHTVKGIYQDLSHTLRKDHVDKKITRYLAQLKPHTLDYDRIHSDIIDLVKKLKIADTSKIKEEDIIRVLSLKMRKDHKIINKDNIGKLAETVQRALKSTHGVNRVSDKVMAVADVIAPLPDSEARALRQKIGDFLSKTARSELDPESIRADIETMVEDPQSSAELIKARLSHINRDTVLALLTQAGLEEGKADKLVEMVLNAATAVRDRYEGMAGAVSYGMESAQSKMHDLPQELGEKIGEYFDSLEVPELSMEVLRMDFEDMLHDPAAAPSILKERLASLNGDSLMAVLKSNPWISGEQVENIAQQVLEARDAVSQMVADIELKAVAQFENLRRRSVIAAENGRRAAVSAAWWTVATATASGGAALLGAYMSTPL